MRLHMKWEWARGTILSFCIRLEAFIEGEIKEICRYDTSHSFFHMDQLYKSGRKEKLIIGNLSLREAFEFAERDLINNREKYVKKYKKG